MKNQIEIKQLCGIYKMSGLKDFVIENGVLVDTAIFETFGLCGEE